MELSEYSPELLNVIAGTHAYLFATETGSKDDFINWLAGRRSTALELIEKVSQICESSNSSCPSIPEQCIEYITEINIQNLKELKAFFIWKNSGKSITNKDETDSNYFNACNEILFFCKKIQKVSALECSFYNDILKRIDRRKKERRTPKSNSKVRFEQRKCERRKDNSIELFFQKVSLNCHVPGNRNGDNFR